MADEIAYRDLKPGEVIQPGDEWQTESGRWALFHQSMIGQLVRGSGNRRPYNITQITRERDGALAELARLQQLPQAADHIVDDNKMVETELERMAWELYLRRHVDQEDAFNKAERFIAERNRRRQAGMTITDVVGD